ncbi:hypothetical protein [Nocardioides sp. L-11A]|uniref:hypothetical protein n=1 Tax=Nocardioides sp. L-11A TaxID=3043848 RepID=UPI00249BD4F6|nr:hypothetical protein QJ852_05160 [Nocardioides sp. L-11A]
MMFDLRVCVLAALLASPVAVLAAQGELTLDEALTRLLVVMVGATAAALLVRTLWPLLAGPAPEPTAVVAPDPVRTESDPQATAGGPDVPGIATAAETELVEAEGFSRPPE